MTGRRVLSINILHEIPMNTELEALLKLSPPRHEAPHHTSAEWLDIEQKLGTKLPNDYRGYIEHYGNSSICDYVVVADPFSTDPAGDLLWVVSHVLETERELYEKHGGKGFPFPPFPDSGGLLPWGHTTNGDQLYWRTVGEPNQWTVVVYGSGSGLYEELPYGMVSFILHVFTGKLTGDIYDFLELEWDDKEIVIEQFLDC